MIQASMAGFTIMVEEGSREVLSKAYWVEGGRRGYSVLLRLDEQGRLVEIRLSELKVKEGAISAYETIERLPPEVEAHFNSDLESMTAGKGLLQP